MRPAEFLSPQTRGFLSGKELDERKLAEQIGHLLDRTLPFLPPEMRREILDYYIDLYESNEARTETSAKWPWFSRMSSPCSRATYGDEDHTLGEADWDFIRDLVNDYAAELDEKLLTEIMAQVVSRGLYLRRSRMSVLFSSFSLKDLRLKNRIVMPPMCMYSSDDGGKAKEWHFCHYQTRAVGGVGLVMVEATAVDPAGRISGQDLGIWDDDHIPGLRKIADLCRSRGAAVGIQLAHAGRKSTVLHTPIDRPEAHVSVRLTVRPNR
jgi:hypothetical protein